MIDCITDKEIMAKFYNITRIEADLAVAIINHCRKFGLTDFLNTKEILPRPVIRDGNGKLIKDQMPGDFYMKLQEEILEFMAKQADIDRDWNATTYDDLAEEIADIITVCISYLNAMGYDEEQRSEIFRRVNTKNQARGYFNVE